ncbi:hypothetical protein OG288_06335 [Streptomyces tauricus]|uniref:Uncharacterized protein n=1 Tax=Streptomyces tauricus TaxID=68274 RepID=A0ABZ1J978_9ACTN|nr:hypothetical protein [Streptomyces tauricus]MCW8098947.1 hypothetical protein [Streptomyces tauricus]
MSTNLFIDCHLLYAVILIAPATVSADDSLGLRRLWGKLPPVRRSRRPR